MDVDDSRSGVDDKQEGRSRVEAGGRQRRFSALSLVIPGFFLPGCLHSKLAQENDVATAVLDLVHHRIGLFRQPVEIF